MVKRIRRTTDCKTELEKYLKQLGSDTNPVDQTQLHNKECVVKYSDVDTAIYTQEEYDFNVYITIELVIDNNNEIPYVIMEIIKNITYNVEQSEAAPWCTSFYFTSSHVTPLNTSSFITLTAKYEPIVDWVTDR